MATKKKVVTKARHRKEKTLDQFTKELVSGTSAAYRVEEKIIDNLRKKNGKIASKYSADKKERETAEGRARFVSHSTQPVRMQAAAQANNVSKDKMRRMDREDAPAKKVTVKKSSPKPTPRSTKKSGNDNWW